MKYIRTKEYGVCKIINEDKHTLSYKNSYVVGCLWKDDYKDQIQYADTIEELCDLIFVDRHNDFIDYCYDFFKIDELSIGLKQKYLGREYDIYSLVKTDKGLIYAAKMNDEGELELL